MAEGVKVGGFVLQHLLSFRSKSTRSPEAERWSLNTKPEQEPAISPGAFTPEPLNLTNKNIKKGSSLRYRDWLDVGPLVVEEAFGFLGCSKQICGGGRNRPGDASGLIARMWNPGSTPNRSRPLTATTSPLCRAIDANVLHLSRLLLVWFVPPSDRLTLNLPDSLSGWRTWSGRAVDRRSKRARSDPSHEQPQRRTRREKSTDRTSQTKSPRKRKEKAKNNWFNYGKIWIATLEFQDCTKPFTANFRCILSNKGMGKHCADH